MTNSDGLETINYTAYAYEMKDASTGADTAVWNALINRNMIGIPIETLKVVETDTVDGSRTEFRFLMRVLATVHLQPTIAPHLIHIYSNATK
ncbi:MAG: hypothetical protein IPJ74_08575 [Saprospiraceae bacterium]|nr:hypothetical protein [Saprospiraceae bacterium]